MAELKYQEKIMACFYRLQLAVNELIQIYSTKNKDEAEFVKSQLFSHYKMSLAYMLTMEYCKLIEQESKRFPNNHIASLYKLNKTVFKAFGEGYKEYENVENALNDFYNKPFHLDFMRTLRDKVFGHEDESFVNQHTIHLSLDVLNQIQLDIDTLLDIYHKCLTPWNYQNFPSGLDNYTEVFINHYSKFVKPDEKLFNKGMGTRTQVGKNFVRTSTLKKGARH